MNLIEKLKYFDDLYFNKGESPITDTEYDLLREKAKKEFPNDIYWTKSGAKIDSKFEEIKLPFTMGGLDKYTPETVLDWIGKEDDDIVASEKLDGNSIGCTWENGILIFAASKGDGITGQNLLNKIKYSIPNIPISDKVSLRGEVLFEGDTFKELGFKKNRRNSVSGLLRRDLINPDDLSKLSVIFYEVIEAPESFKLDTILKKFSFIGEVLKLRTPNYFLIPKENSNPIEFLVNGLKEYKEYANYDIDGLVLIRNTSQLENVMYPKNQIKFKVNEDAVRCKVIDIKWNVTRQSYIKPVILIEPTEILGVTVSRVNGFNSLYIYVHNIGKGSEIGVVRSGDVIPYVTEVFVEAEPDIPVRCPDCKGMTALKSKDLMCINPKCFQKNIREVSHFFTELGVDGMSTKTIENIGKTSIPEIYKLTFEDLVKIPGFGEKKALSILSEVKKTLKTKPEKLLAAFGINLIGSALAKQLCSKFTFSQLFEIKDPKLIGLGPITSETFINNIGNYLELYNYLLSIGLEFIEEDENSKSLKGMKFALTGEGPIKRKDIQKLIENLGGEVGGVHKDTNYLVTNNFDSTHDKMKVAKKYKIPVISYEDLYTNYLKK